MPRLRLTPSRSLGAALAAGGVALLLANRHQPDESRVTGLVLVLAGLLAAVAPERARRQRVAQVAAVVFLFLLGGEWMVRRENARAERAYAESTMHMVDDPMLRYEMKPYVQGTNARGMLDVERDPPKPPGVYRVACVGDSVGGDFSLPRDNACAQLQGELGRLRGGPVEALNFSVPGYNTLQEARTFEVKAMPFSPDALVVLFVMNDPYPDLAISHMLPGHLKFEHLLTGGLRTIAGRWLHIDVDPFAGAIAPLFEEERSWKGVVVAGFDRIAAVARPRDIPVVVAVFPLFVPGADVRYGRLYRQVVDEAERHGFVGLDLGSAAFQGEPLEALWKPSRDPIHPNAHAHALAARAIAGAIARGLVMPR